MRYLLAALLAIILLSGCMNDPEEHNFYYGGWRHPEKAAEERLHSR